MEAHHMQDLAQQLGLDPETATTADIREALAGTPVMDAEKRRQALQLLRAVDREQADVPRPPAERAERMLEQSRQAFNDLVDRLALAAEDPAVDVVEQQSAALVSNALAAVYGPLAAIGYLMLPAPAPEPAGPVLSDDAIEQLAMRVWHGTQEAGASTSVGDAAAAIVRDVLTGRAS
jgi:hypothetical protein